LLRPGRFDFKIEIKKPDATGCLRILEIATRNMPLEEGVDLGMLVPKLLGSSGADIVFVAKEAAIGALRRSVDVGSIVKDTAEDSIPLNEIKVRQEDFLTALEELKINKRITAD